MNLNINCKIPVPITFNCWKHHAGFIKNRIDVFKRKNISGQELKKLLLVIGNSQMDIYLGKLSPQMIVKEVIDELNRLGINSADKFKKWLTENHKHFKLLKISDASLWTLRLGIQEDRYVHIHPGRYSSHTIRVKALTLKTTITAMIGLKSKDVTNLDLEFINDIRRNFLGISPLKTLSFSSGLGKFIVLLSAVKN